MASLAVLGSWRPEPGSELYSFAEQSGCIAGGLGWSVLSGGYTGIMDAALKGASQAGAGAVAYTWKQLDDLLPVSIHHSAERKFNTVSERVAGLVGDADACLVMPGRTGTIAELALAVERRAKGELRLPVILYRDYWDSFTAWLEQSNNALQLLADPKESRELFIKIHDAVELKAILGQLAK